MSALAIIQRAQVAGVKLCISDTGGLKCAGNTRILALLKPELIAHKSEILEALSHADEVESWLRQKLDSAQPAASIEAQAVQMGFPLEQLNAARLAIGASVSTCLGVTYWQLTDKIDREAVRDALAKIAAELGFVWDDLLSSDLIKASDFDQYTIDFDATAQDQWRDYIASLGMRARHGCPGLAHRIVCDCAGQCRAFRS